MDRLDLSVLLAALLIAGCGGGGGSDRAPIAGAPPVAPPPAFGLTARAPLAPLDLPLGAGNLGSYALEDAFPALSFPDAVFLAAVPGQNRLVVVQQSGFVRAFVDDAATGASAVVLDLSARVTFGGEEGLLGLAFDPAFAQNGFFYVHYSAPTPRRSVIARFTWDPVTDRAALESERILLEIAQPYSNHNGGMLAFGPDDMLYIGMGDGGNGGDPQNNAQNPGNLLGSMLRIDPHPADPADGYDVPADNPFLGDPDVRPETYAFGLRNPFRFSFDRATGDLWLGDVGQGEREEIDLIVAGGNYGWRVLEGTLPYDDSANTLPLSAFTPPVFEYDHGLGVAVIGGYVYRGSRVPSLQGRYLYGDWISGTIWALDYDRTAGVVRGNDVIATTDRITSFGEDSAGDVYVVGGAAGILRFEETASGTGSEPPALLSQTGVFTSLATLEPASGLVEYAVNHPFWSDGTSKRRWVAVPDAARIGFAATGAWTFPVGSVVVKHFEIDMRDGDAGSRRRLETRLLIHRADGWRGFTYRWNPSGTEATLLAAREQELLDIELPGGGVRQQLYEYPSPTDCLGCHTAAAGFTLGLETRQLNRDFTYAAASDNQLRSLDHIAYFDRSIGDAAQYDAFAAAEDAGAPLAERARAYLHVNCAQCHRPGGPTPVDLDLRFDTALAATNAIDVLPTSGSLGIADARIIAPGDRARSVLWARMQAQDGDRMPSIGSRRVDDAAVALIGDWIDTL